MKIARCTMKEFREHMGGDEAMLEFAANNLDTPDDARVVIRIDADALVTFAIIKPPPLGKVINLADHADLR